MNVRVDRVKRAAEGRWPEIFASAGMDPSHFERVNRPCPLCGGRDRFSFDRRKTDGHWFCRGCGYGDGIDLVARFTHQTFSQTLVWLEDRLGIPREPYKRTKASDFVSEGESNEKKRLQRLTREWEEAVPMEALSMESPLRRYLSQRGLRGCEDSRMLRMASACPYWDQENLTPEGKPKCLGTFPAMIARVTDDEGKLTTLHRTYLTEDGRKAPVPSVKKLAAGSVGDGLVRLYPASSLLCLSEGIETALAVHELTGLPVWSAISVMGFRHVVSLPKGLKRLCICGDNDASYTGAAGAYALAARLLRDYPDLKVTVHVPETTGEDWNDVLLAGGTLQID